MYKVFIAIYFTVAIAALLRGHCKRKLKRDAWKEIREQEEQQEDLNVLYYGTELVKELKKYYHPCYDAPCSVTCRHGMTSDELVACWTGKCRHWYAQPNRGNCRKEEWKSITKVDTRPCTSFTVDSSLENKDCEKYKEQLTPRHTKGGTR